MRPESTSVVFREELATLAKEYDDEKAAGRFIAKKVAPIIRLSACDGTYPTFNRETFVKPASTNRAADGSYNRITGEFGQANYACEEHGLEYRIDDKMRRKYARLFAAENAAMKILRFQQLMAYERRVAALFSGSGSTNHNVTTAWTTNTTCVPLNDIATGVNTLTDSCGCSELDIGLIIPRVDWQEMNRTTQFINKFQYTYGKNNGLQPSLLPAQEIAAMLGIGDVFMASGAYDTTESGITPSMSQIWTGAVMYLFVVCKEEEPLEIPSAARTIMWDEDASELPVMESYREDHTRSDILRSRDNTDEVVMGETDLFIYKLTNT